MSRAKMITRTMVDAALAAPVQRVTYSVAWSCEGCNKIEAGAFPRQITLLNGLAQIQKAHAIASPGCAWSSMVIPQWFEPDTSKPLPSLTVRFAYPTPERKPRRKAKPGVRV